MTGPFQKSVVSPVLIDRVNELATLQALIDQEKSGRGQVVLLSGEAGIGKSRLVAEVKTEAVSRDLLLMQGSCFPTDYAIPYAPLRGSLLLQIEEAVPDKSKIVVLYCAAGVRSLMAGNTLK